MSLSSTLANTDQTPQLKRRKLDQPVPIYPTKTTAMSSNNSFINQHGTIVNNTNGTITPNTYAGVTDDVEMLTEESFSKKHTSLECPCGHLHGPGQGHDHDIAAVGFLAEPLLRGPE
ncbi:predicted protein [Scheffersomyces stipitis CBS 6054]|uniref:Uncharacterized protein n=1 Tax=Scheffersomyces stipitis (strain ATCC 58785 / CBS 6054 / NBRC 10063 / NRRL Y-11545) TaxID=322104 RepID=A3M0C0_PICST|nr:predicted protein [Scheffersomyces stipitis CBS 6054]ABN68493.1 predicted protein [Scheffersomyces stipitis CBS 6054]